jgi:hypothetical protein
MLENSYLNDNEKAELLLNAFYNKISKDLILYYHFNTYKEKFFNDLKINDFQNLKGAKENEK